MDGWKTFCTDFIVRGLGPEILKEKAQKGFGEYGVYPDSIHILSGSAFFLARGQAEKHLIVCGDAGARFEGEDAAAGNLAIRICPMNIRNCTALRGLFPFLTPSPGSGRDISVGFGDRLGAASPAHIRLVRTLPVYPVLAQQSVRELTLTGRSFAGVISDAAWAVFQEGYEKGYGADGDHLKTGAEVESALASGCTMITLDCLEHIRNEIETMPAAALREEYAKLDRAAAEKLESTYLNRTFPLGGGPEISFTEESFYRTVLIYYRAVLFAGEIYHSLIAPYGREIDFEVSIDETLTPTAPEAHYFVASELSGRGVKLSSVAPRFCGEFQKGINYKGDLGQFEREYPVHEAVARTFGYKLSIHSGSDKFDVFPVIGRYSPRYHLKTAGTSWLEAVRMIAVKQPGLYRRIHRFACEHFHEATKYYHVTTDLNKVPDADTLTDAQLPGLLGLEDTRQMLHITYGLILQAKAEDGSHLLRPAIYRALYENEEEHYRLLSEHLGRHLNALGLRQN